MLDKIIQDLGFKNFSVKERFIDLSELNSKNEIKIDCGEAVAVVSDFYMMGSVSSMEHLKNGKNIILTSEESKSDTIDYNVVSTFDTINDLIIVQSNIIGLYFRNMIVRKPSGFMFDNIYRGYLKYYLISPKL